MHIEKLTCILKKLDSEFKPPKITITSNTESQNPNLSEVAVTIESVSIVLTLLLIK